MGRKRGNPARSRTALRASCVAGAARDDGAVDREWKRILPVLQLRNISKNFGAIQALTDVDLTLEPGEVLGLMGDNGAGKSTLVKIIAGNFPPTGGEIVLDGEPVHFHKPVEARAEGHRGRLSGPRALRQSDRGRERLSRARARSGRIGPFTLLDYTRR